MPSPVADLALLIVAALTPAQLAGYLALGRQLGITCLVEAHTPDEVRQARDAGAELLGINNRNLKTLAVDLANFEQMASLIDGEAIRVAESGILSLADARRMREAGADAVLVGGNCWSVTAIRPRWWPPCDRWRDLAAQV